MIEKGRLLAITDGIVAVAATVMVLRLEVPERASLAAAGRQLPVLLAYLISYTQIFLAWHEHHDTFLRVERISHTVFLLNCLWLFFVTLLPFVTGVVGSSPRHTPSVLLYLAVLTAEEGSLLLLCRTLLPPRGGHSGSVQHLPGGRQPGRLSLPVQPGHHGRDSPGKRL